MLMLLLLFILQYLIPAHAAAPTATPSGPFTTAYASYNVSTMDRTDQWIDIYYPNDNTTGRRWPLLSYAHGLYGGGAVDSIAYKPLLQAMASYGFVIVFPRSCNSGCSQRCISLPSDPLCFGNFYEEQLKALVWAQEQSNNASGPAHSILLQVNHTVGYGIAGHSMGGQATLFSSSFQNATQHQIKAAVFHHVYTHETPSPTIPFLAFTGSTDITAPPAMTHAFFDEAAKSGLAPNRGIVVKKDADHVEPLLWNMVPRLAQYSAAWLKIHLEQVDQQDGRDYAEMIYGTSAESLCGGGDGTMTECVVTPRK